MDLATIRHLDAVQTIELRYQGVGIVFDMSVIVGKDLAQQLVFCVMDGFNDILVVAEK